MDVQPVYFGIVGLFIGFIIGYTTKHLLSHPKSPIKEKQTITFLIVLTWIMSVFFDAMNPAYATPYMVHIITGMIIGHLFEVDITKFLKK